MCRRCPFEGLGLGSELRAEGLKGPAEKVEAIILAHFLKEAELPAYKADIRTALA